MQYDLDMASPHRSLFISARAYLLSQPGIDLGFLQGAFLADAPNRLTGAGERLRVLSLRECERDFVAYYVEQATALIA